jgi:hypothetical protein
MKKKLISVLPIIAVLFAACNNNGTKNEQEGHETNKDTVQHATTIDNKEIKEVAVTYINVDVKAAASLKEIVGHYLHIKNALANDNGSEAANGGKAMEQAMSKIDKSFFTTEQKKVYDDIEDELKEHAEHIGKNGDKIEHQREHFAMMSEVIYELVKAFGAGQPIYHDHCPMYNENTGGAMWLSEAKELSNPYFGAKMPKCGKVEEVIK